MDRHSVVVRTGALGDFVATIPVLDALRERGDLTVFAPMRYRVLFPYGTWVDVDGIAGMKLLSGGLDLNGCDVGVAWTTAAGDGLRACGVGKTYVGTPRPTGPIHDHLWAPLVPLLGSRDRDPRIVPEEAAVAGIRTRAARPIVISPGSGGVAKRWPISRWRAVADALPGQEVVWIAGPLEISEPGWGAPRWDDLDLSGLVALASIARAWLAPDSGPAHVAAAAGSRSGVVFQSTDPAIWAPPGAQVFDASTEPSTVAAWAAGRL